VDGAAEFFRVFFRKPDHSEHAIFEFDMLGWPAPGTRPLLIESCMEMQGTIAFSVCRTQAARAPLGELVG